jgi:hypothetical protein
MSHEITFSRFAYFDTNILSTLAKNISLWQPLQVFLYENDLCLALAEGQIAELSSDTRLHAPLNSLLTIVPSALIKTHKVIFDEEVKAHPGRRIDTLFHYPLNALFGKNELENYLSSPELKDARDEQKNTSALWIQKITSLKSNFPPGKTGKYDKSQAWLFAWTLTIQKLQADYLDFLELFKNNVKGFNAETFLSSQIAAYVIFYKYYLTGQSPSRSSDFGDMFQLRAMPYCELVVVERNMCEILNQIQKNTSILNGVTIKNIKFLEDWKL